LDEIAPDKRRITWSYADRDADVFITRVEEKDGDAVLKYAYNGAEHELRAPLHSEADYENAANALTFMLYRGVAPDVIAGRFRDLRKIGTRLNVSEGVNNCMLIRDSYTSDYSSLRPALHFARRRQPADHGLTLIMSDLKH